MREGSTRYDVLDTWGDGRVPHPWRNAPHVFEDPDSGTTATMTSIVLHLHLMPLITSMNSTKHSKQP
jgi:hypothetical protein